MIPACKVLFSGATLTDWRNGYRNGSLLLINLFETIRT